ncbi:MAG: CDP-alcohol phosphatidyltransferase family protein, partial [Myxococcales bacterium]|nr:CDP-alcohol phosphatidyltransferase family protein [Myxococcales bacterium]
MTRLFAKERIAKLRQKQESSFTPIFLHRPLAILFLIPTADIAWVTPNRITFVSTIMRFITAALLWPEAMGGIHETPATLWTAILLWHLGSVFDAMDGALARYRGTSSAFGRFIDKVPDRMIALALVLSISARAYVETNEVLY